MRLIETSQLKSWAGSRLAEDRFPYILKRLITAVLNPKNLRIPSGDAVWVPGFDGIVVNNEENRFVPTGFSVWEAGTTSEYKRKAESDYEKRSQIHPDDKKAATVQGVERSQITFVFATPFIWSDKESWISERKAENIWKDVCVIDGVDIQDWLEEAPAVSLQLAAEMGYVPDIGLQTLDQAWDEWSYLTEPPLSEEVVIAGRGEQEKELISQLISLPRTLTIRGDSPREAWGFALAVMRRLENEDERSSIASRTIVAENEGVANRLLNYQFKNLIIVLKQTTGQVSGHLTSRGFHVLLPEGNDDRSSRNIIQLIHPVRRLFIDAITKIGFPEDEALRVSRASGFSVTVLQRQLAHANFVRPAWMNDENLNILIPALLAGRWNSQNSADREIICQLINSPDYASFESKLQLLLWVDEPPVRKIDNMWMLTAPADTFQLIARYIRTADIERFKDAFRVVFSTIDSKVESPPDEWIYADVKGDAKIRHSPWIRSGLAETLLLISERGENAKLECVSSPRSFAEYIVRGLPGLENDWRILASLRDQYARLMEAVPDPFLDHLEHLLEVDPDGVRRLFVEGQSAFGSGSMQTGLIWGLETIAWSPEYLPRSALLLAHLAVIDPGGRISNRPINSLRNIFLWWYPCTNATIDEKLAVIDLVVNIYPDVGWQLLASLLPEARQSISSGTATPIWRDFGDIPEEALSRSGQYRYVSGIIDRTLNLVGDEAKRWKAVLDSMSVFSPSEQEKIIHLLEQIAISGILAVKKTELWEVLREFVHRNQVYREADWALGIDLLGRIEKILPQLASENPVERNHWLFDDWLSDPTSDNDSDEQSKETVEESRQQAIREIFAISGVDGIVELGITSRIPGFVALAASQVVGDIDMLALIIKKSIYSGETGVIFAGHISGEALKSSGELWREKLFAHIREEKWSSNVKAKLLFWWPDELSTWEYANMLGISEEYWRYKPLFVLNGTQENKILQVEQLIKVGRAHQILHLVSFDAKDIPTFVLVRVLDSTLEEFAQAQSEEQIRQMSIDTHYINRFLTELRSRPDLPKEELARREYSILPLLGYIDVHGLTIQEIMAEDPDLFVDLLCDAFHPHNRDKTKDTAPTPASKARGSAAFSLLRGMDRIPGAKADGAIDETDLLNWINSVREKAQEKDRAIIADHHIGQILAHAPNDPKDEAWPHQAIRIVIEKLTAEQVEQGLKIERFNMRGIYHKALFEGGKQERALAAEYRDWASTIRAKWPRTAHVLEMIAQTWDENARREDLEAEQEKSE